MKDPRVDQAMNKLREAKIGLAKLDDKTAMAFSTENLNGVINVFPVPTQFSTSVVDNIVDRMSKAREEVA